MAQSSEFTKNIDQGCTLYKLPPELWGGIFTPLYLDWNGKTPNLIKALRPEKKIYVEALEIFYKHNVFKLHSGNGWSFGDMTKGAVLSVARVRICVE